MEGQRSMTGLYLLPPSLHPRLDQDSRCMGLLKLAQLLNVVHQVTPGDILHHKIQAILGASGHGLEARTRPPGFLSEQQRRKACEPSIRSGQSWVSKWTVPLSRQTERLGIHPIKNQEQMTTPTGRPR